MDKNYEQFVDKLNLYIRKFYLYRLLRGLFLVFLLLSGYFLVLSVLEYLNYFDPHVKFFIFLLTIFFILFVLVYFICIPVVRLLGLGRRITFYDVSLYLSKIYPEIKDRLINIIELENESDSVYSFDLKRASIDQKINELKIYNFSDSIRFKDLKWFFLSFLFSLLLFFFFLFFSPDFFKSTSVRLIHFQQKFEKPLPYTFHLLNTDLNLIIGESVELKLQCSGRKLPDKVYINFLGNDYLMTFKNGYFTYTIENLNSPVSFYFTDKKYVSDIYKVSIINKPFISSFEVFIQPPSYTGLNSDKSVNTGDLKVMSGSVVKWVFKAIDTDSLFLLFSDSTKIKAVKKANDFEVVKSISKDIDYRVFIKNSNLSDKNNLVYRIQTVSDLYPEIKIVQVRDSVDFNVFHFKGNIIDDFGFHKLEFTINSDAKDSVFSLPFIPFMLNQDFYYSFDFKTVSNFGKSFKYYFSVYDNDFVNHFKKTISETFTFVLPDYHEIISKENSEQKDLNLLFNDGLKLTDDIQKELKNLKLKQVDSEMTDWEKFQSVKDIMNKRNELENILNQVKQKNENSNKFLNSFTDEKSDLLKKQQQIENLLKDVFNDELKKLFDEFNELAKKFDSNKLEKISKQMDLRLNDLSKQLEKDVQLLKRMKIEQKIERVHDELIKLSDIEKSNKEKVNKEKLEIETIERNSFKHLSELESDYNDVFELNKSLERPLNIFHFDKEFGNIKSNYEHIIENLDTSNKRKVLNELNNNLNDLDQLAFAMDQMMKNNEVKQYQENIDDLKQILNNLIVVSFDQEAILNSSAFVTVNNPLINDIRLKQKNLMGQITFVKDSLYALGKREPAVGNIINKEILNLETNVEFAYNNLESGNVNSSRVFQQYSITSLNNLALFLSESLEKIKEQEKKSKGGKGACENPGKNSKSGMKSLQESQKSIKQQLQQMIDQLKKGENGQLSKSIGKTLVQQEIMQQMLRELINNGVVGSETTDQLKFIDKMIEQSRKDLIDRNITGELLNRQNMILTKLLEAEKAEIERDTDDKRESKTGKDIIKTSPQGYFEYNNKLKKEDELLKKDNFKLKSFYDQKYNNYMNRLKN